MRDTVIGKRRMGVLGDHPIRGPVIHFQICIIETNLKWTQIDAFQFNRFSADGNALFTEIQLQLSEFFF
ncbi:hypothetical protein Pan153_53130 [Gimesia panareensis]|uniref:Uncharacterized protein n=1 Tax=Gimesia panareensis TaxID=2527978 RepID=A0A518FW96_9PLAN|nr:hypothetical protein Pan153_53130 [Gimesia panareensis]